MASKCQSSFGDCGEYLEPRAYATTIDKDCPTATPDLNQPPHATPSSARSPATTPVSRRVPKKSATTMLVVSSGFIPVSKATVPLPGGSAVALKSSSFGSPNPRPSQTAIVATGTESYLATTLITPTLIASSVNVTASLHVSATASVSACAHSFPKCAGSQVFKREEVDEDCVPCEGQGGSLPFGGVDHTTDNYKFTPKTCRTVYYNLDITNTTLSPDGQERIVLAVNGQLPDPLLEANRGDTVIVTVNNQLQDKLTEQAYTSTVSGNSTTQNTTACRRLHSALSSPVTHSPTSGLQQTTAHLGITPTMLFRLGRVLSAQ